MNPTFFAPDWCGLAWTDFVRLPMQKTTTRTIPNGAGVYRVRVVGRNELAYIGQTGRNLNERLRGLGSGLYASDMPYNDPHTAAPKLWSYRDGEGFEFEASATESTLPKNDRMGLECWLVWRYRQEKCRSTLCNFGRLHPRYITSRNRTTGQRGRKLNPDEPDNTGGTSVAPLARQGTAESRDWMGLAWSAPLTLDKINAKSVPRGPGVYRLSNGTHGIIYIGQSLNLSSRLRTHADTDWSGLTAFAFASMPESYTETQLLEVENDLIAGYFEEFRAAPLFQFGATTPAEPASDETASG
ncbi:Uncharacterized protein OS=Methanosphaerula palustris (strain ATCC BAA-1556 / DSM 19958 / E1-9c) GN=Mpal_2492 PE=4 SV=1: GIY-YIG [Gemmataceae bacterium]|nr:Uncharacterized protein OS=Methanosphaerula palustris (strain ATCC BAA-1556 / DSM 19958 / E1-9c) GN=Mpal_2492 PE=4 SV=1: GIY-YIG [Gemmataceae bacterium]VTU02434.1 Uncharacterized protein OS=Methanosphaerula palustris (strain ATCC BAA-1556 / DSM 19958 / E1-9c) GN=Mpal_2492 PE=4 SV=1: GIY-YIG [Gemmataceae bacterium]